MRRPFVAKGIAPVQGILGNTDMSRRSGLGPFHVERCEPGVGGGALLRRALANRGPSLIAESVSCSDRRECR